ncbi:hypothetical protein CH260_02210 [Rhodococcus sp. 05-2256-B2]|uniref:DUF2975 domain-containing protein n=1 Tax=unclassified Rhodococcus (in: high G+C Gram-positive bacteria) TaxID=192944 RepID=UPI000B9B0A6A|nr:MULTISPECIES: DUF2975 domain-containing protein [unclassified Rhodococcus (in: high G+C Gram-positive bacteria)]OZD78649.1 hypothetical protein CH258_21740 [Rhodococcus sp. 05-2256-B4]OZD93749.1 hypothetical protein CH257_09615 [Rhodococcus sp. 05-2256-B3]OZE00849.1 hypothetical protein CH260_02210 [Rhodococcus sp. 05-2256-B2]OZE04453.1 hypothetical protein CH285_08370 [Rhodococcus sp. 05-2256-B1]
MLKGYRAVVLLLRLFLAALFAVLVLMQVMSLPGQFAHMAQESPESAYLRWPLTIVSIFWVLCIQVVVIATWKLLTMVNRNAIFTRASLVWVDTITWSIVAAWVVLVGVFLYVGFGADDPGLPLLLFLLVVVVAVAALLMVVMRTLLSQTTELRSDMDAVI